MTSLYEYATQAKSVPLEENVEMPDNWNEHPSLRFQPEAESIQTCCQCDKYQHQYGPGTNANLDNLGRMIATTNCEHCRGNYIAFFEEGVEKFLTMTDRRDWVRKQLGNYCKERSVVPSHRRAARAIEYVIKTLLAELDTLEDRLDCFRTTPTQYPRERYEEEMP